MKAAVASRGKVWADVVACAGRGGGVVNIR